MNAYEHDHGHEHDESLASPKRPGPHEEAELPHLLKAAATGRTEVLGPSGMGTLQRTVGNSAVRAALQRDAEQGEEGERRSSVHDVISSGGGEPLDTGTRGDMEARLGADFGDVRVHTGSSAHESAKEVGAHAYTVGNDVVFQRDAYDPSSQQGRTTIAHELTHVIQQRGGPVDGTEAPGGIRVSDPSDRFEREASANAERVMAGPSPAPEPAAAPAPASAAPPVQRQEADEDEEPADVQGSFVQRAAEAGAEDEEEAPPEG
ncbi:MULTISPECIES: eCIS core domain-containing protein [Streptomyces]|uniref:eCIS core domain-containing protein n=1 Tax=Streptomyces autolyticus TaxID=75293 RepID=A0ABM6HNY4_9ACTN|nr:MULTISPECIES: DUF4157 domain-containing protein [Streptomyces]WPB88823.1 DUF4157 domain-containing protein [Streptomyces malaysiensis]AQA15742.1 hypothetical protein BV401_40395 [Streptomyces autolyticus]MCD9590094.1 DUF4157 domain-containing protein [Streptomyces sp. 8ZJF_21]MCM3809782.1 DUF4157 domain-containing protein [Streptomyces sp. DR7-3]WHX16714.1 DUF4157 domain-containing protein [Streptomyces sp. NA07423]